MWLYGGFLKWWVSPTTMGFPTKNDHFFFLGVPPFKGNTHINCIDNWIYILCGDLCMVRRYTGTPQKHMFFSAFFRGRLEIRGMALLEETHDMLRPCIWALVFHILEGCFTFWPFSPTLPEHNLFRDWTIPNCPRFLSTADIVELFWPSNHLELLFLQQSWFSGKWQNKLKGNYYWRYTHCSLNHMPWLWEEECIIQCKGNLFQPLEIQQFFVDGTATQIFPTQKKPW